MQRPRQHHQHIPESRRITMRCAACRYDLTAVLEAGFSRCPECGQPSHQAVPIAAAALPPAPTHLVALGLAAPAIAVALAHSAAPLFAHIAPTTVVDLAAALLATPLCFVAAYHVEERTGQHEAPSVFASFLGFVALLANGAAVTLVWFAYAAIT